MIAPTKVDVWWAEAVVRVFEPWLTSGCVGITDRQRREVAEMVGRARRISGDPRPRPAPEPAHRTQAGRWRPAV